MGENMLLSVSMVAEKIRMACLQADGSRRVRTGEPLPDAGTGPAVGPKHLTSVEPGSWIPRMRPRRQAEIIGRGRPPATRHRGSAQGYAREIHGLFVNRPG